MRHVTALGVQSLTCKHGVGHGRVEGGRDERGGKGVLGLRHHQHALAVVITGAVVVEETPSRYLPGR